MKINLHLTLAFAYFMCSTNTNYNFRGAMALSSSSVISSTDHKHNCIVENTKNRLHHLKKQKKMLVSPDEGKKSKCEVCPEPMLDLDMDRKEAVFSTLGYLWAKGSYRASEPLWHSL